MVDDTGTFTWPVPFWQQPLDRWTQHDGRRRSRRVGRQLAEPFRMMLPRDNAGLIVNISFWAAQKFIGNTLYGVSKAATDKLTADMAHELVSTASRSFRSTPVWFGTESVLEAAQVGVFDLSNSESPEFIGRVIAALGHDPRSPSAVDMSSSPRRRDRARRADIDGKRPIPLALDTV